MLLLVVLGVQTYRNARVRRTVGIIWDLATFWPRAAHPLAPPCYAERVVPELVHRATWLATEQGGVVLSGHSQGSVLVAATVLQLPPQARPADRAAHLRLPAVPALPAGLPELLQRDGHQRHRGGRRRPTRPGALDQPVAAHRPDRRPRRHRRPPARRPGRRSIRCPATGSRRPSQAHSGYQLTPQFGQAMDDLVGLLNE